MIVVINSFSFLESGLSEEVISKNDITILSPSKVKSTFPFLTEKTIFLDHFTHEKILEACQKFKKTSLGTQFVANGEENIPLVGLLNEKKGVSSDFLQSICFTDKYYMRTALVGKVSQPKFYLVNSSREASAVFQSQPTSYILKPRSQSSAIGIHIVSTLEEINCLSNNLNNYIMEEFVDYDIMLTSDGIAAGGKPLAFFVHEYGEKITESIKNSKYATVSTSHLYVKNLEIIDELLSLTAEVLDNLDTSPYPIPYHFEWFYNSITQELVFCEGASRFGGAEIPKLIQSAFEIDIKSLYWDLLFDSNALSSRQNIYEATYPSYYATAFLSYRYPGSVKKLPEFHSTEWFEKYTCYVKLGDTIKQAENAVENIFNAVFKVEDYDETPKKIQQCLDLLENEVIIAK